MIFFFNTRRRARLIKLMNCFFKMPASEIQRISALKSWETEKILQAFKVVCNKEMGYLAAAKILTFLVLNYTITFAQIGTLFKASSQNWGFSQLFLQFLQRSLLDISY